MGIREIFKTAKGNLKGKWGFSIGISLLSTLMGLVTGAIGASIPIIGPIAVMIFVTPVLFMGIYWTFLKITDGEPVALENMFDGFKDYNRAMLAPLLHHLIIAGVIILPYIIGFMLLFMAISPRQGVNIGILIVGFIVMLGGVISVIIAGLAYSQYYYILKDNPGMTAAQSLKESRLLMQGFKGKYFLMQLAFVLFFLPSIVFFVGGAVMIGSANARPWIVNNPFLGLGVTVLIVGFMTILATAVLIIPFMLACYPVFYRSLVPKKEDDDVESDFIFETNSTNFYQSKMSDFDSEMDNDRRC